MHILTQDSLINGIDREKKTANASLAYVQCILSAMDVIAMNKERRSSGEEELFKRALTTSWKVESN